MTKYGTRFAEADLFVAGLLAFLYGLVNKQDKFNVYLQIFITIMRKLVCQAESNDTLVTSSLRPILREMIIEASRFVNENSSDIVLQFCQRSRIAMGDQDSIYIRLCDIKEFFGIEIYVEGPAFYLYFWSRLSVVEKMISFYCEKRV